MLVVAGLLNEQDVVFSNTAEANQFLVKGEPSYIGNRHAAIAMRWRENFKTANSIRNGVPQAKLDFSNSPPEELEKFLRNINASTVPSALALLQRTDFSSIKTLLDVACGGAGIAITITKATKILRELVENYGVRRSPSGNLALRGFEDPDENFVQLVNSVPHVPQFRWPIRRCEARGEGSMGGDIPWSDPRE